MPNRIPVSPPAVSAVEMAAVDTLAMARGLELLQMMENAGALLARLTHSEIPAHSTALVLAGPGGNGGGALVAARRLAGFGHRVHVIPTAPPRTMSPAAAHQWRLLEQIDTLSLHPDLRPDAELPTGIAESAAIVDGMLGYSLRGAPREPVAGWIEAANRHPAPKIALDLPSGLDPDHGTTPGEAVRAAITLTLALPKHGLLTQPGAALAGRLALGDIGIPPPWVAEVVPHIEAGDWYPDGDLTWLSSCGDESASGTRKPAFGIWSERQTDDLMRR